MKNTAKICGKFTMETGGKVMGEGTFKTSGKNLIMSVGGQSMTFAKK